MLLLSPVEFSNYMFQKILAGALSLLNRFEPEQTDILSAVIWVQIACIGYQQMTEVTASMERVKQLIFVRKQKPFEQASV